MHGLFTRLLVRVRLFFARRAAEVAEAKARELRSEINARTARMFALPPGSDHRGFAAAAIHLDLPTVWDAEMEAQRARAVVDELAKQRDA